MKYLPEFEYLVPENVAELCSLLSLYGSESCILAGGTDLLVRLKRGEISPKVLLDIGRINELSALRDEGSHIFIGAAATHTQIAESPLIKREAPLLSEAASSVGSVQIRNSGTIGGNIVNASPAGDTLPPLIALEAEASIIRQGGERTVPLSSLFSGPYQSALAPDEFLAGIRVLKPLPGSGTCFLKLGRRRALAVSRITLSALLVLDGKGLIQRARICPGAVLPSPRRMGGAEEGLLGLLPDTRLFRKAGQWVAREMVRVTGRRSSTPYKEPVVINLVERALTVASERCLKREG
jgi:CO/xanthine dehydrogenase FAD-binding subunit